MNEIIKDFERAVQKLEEVLSLERNEIIRDSAIKRFELCFDLAWKSIKNFAKMEGLECYSPRECFKIAFQLKLIEYDEKWLEMIGDRNLTVHVYKEEIAEAVYEKLPEYLKMFKNFLRRLKKRI